MCPMMKLRLLDIQVFNVLEAVAQIAEERVIEVFQHPPLPDDVAHTFGSDHCMSVCQKRS